VVCHRLRLGSECAQEGCRDSAGFYQNLGPVGIPGQIVTPRSFACAASSESGRMPSGIRQDTPAPVKLLRLSISVTTRYVPNRLACAIWAHISCRSTGNAIPDIGSPGRTFLTVWGMSSPRQTADPSDISDSGTRMRPPLDQFLTPPPEMASRLPTSLEWNTSVKKNGHPGNWPSTPPGRSGIAR
jgi:hypothetical protein